VIDADTPEEALEKAKKIIGHFYKKETLEARVE